MKKLLWMLVLPIAFSPSLFASDLRCHSEEFTKAKRQLENLVLNKAQKEAIAGYEATFQKRWAETHREKGCTHHEAHAKEFIAAASGVLTDDQFKNFRGRARTEAETVQNEVWSTGVYIKNLIKIAKSA